MPTNTNQNPLDLDEKVLLKNKCTIPRFESIVVWGRTHQTMMMGYRLNVMTQAPYLEDRAQPTGRSLHDTNVLRTQGWQPDRDRCAP